jgi:hypothetical protein
MVSLLVQLNYNHGSNGFHQYILCVLSALKFILLLYKD